MKIHTDQIKIELTYQEARMLLAYLEAALEEDPLYVAHQSTGLPMNEIAIFKDLLTRNLKGMTNG